MSDILCPDCGHDIDEVEWRPGSLQWGCGDQICYNCDCTLSPSGIARALLAERDAKLAAVRKFADWMDPGAPDPSAPLSVDPILTHARDFGWAPGDYQRAIAYAIRELAGPAEPQRSTGAHVHSL